MARKRSQKNNRIQVHPRLYQLCRAGERFEVGDGPVDLGDVENLILGRGTPRKSRSGKACVDDPWMSSRHARVVKNLGGHIRGSARFYVEDLSSTNGILVNGHATKKCPLAHGDLIETGRTFWLYQENKTHAPIIKEPISFGTWVTWNPALASDLTRLRDEVSGEGHILLTGPEGVGKGFMARTIHLMSQRPGRFVHLDCEERSDARLRVELFGKSKEGSKLKDAQNGTLFLENIDKLPTGLQKQLAQTLSASENEKSESDNLRVVASIATLLKPSAADSRIEASLLKILSEIQVHIPGLSERREDFGLLLDDFLARARGALAIHRDACRAVLEHEWRLHVKALSRVIEAAATLGSTGAKNGTGADAGRIELRHLPLEVVGERKVKPAQKKPSTQAKPPSFQVGDLGLIDRASHQEDEELTEAIPIPAPPKPAGDPKTQPPSMKSGEFLDAIAEIQDMMEDFEHLDPTDPLMEQRLISRELTPKHVEPEATEMLDVSDPASEFQEMVKTERSYATAVDPDVIVDALERSRGNISAAARYLGKPRALVQKWMNEFQLSIDDYRDV
jgi:DNA-binding NtrC family response regulator